MQTKIPTKLFQRKKMVILIKSENKENLQMKNGENNMFNSAAQQAAQQQQMLNFQQQHNMQQQMSMRNMHTEMAHNANANSELSPKRQAVVDRLKRRFEMYRNRQIDCAPRFDQTFNGVCEQQSLETSALQKRFFENKAKRSVKKTEKKQIDLMAPNLSNNVLVVSL